MRRLVPGLLILWILGPSVADAKNASERLKDAYTRGSIQFGGPWIPSSERRSRTTGTRRSPQPTQTAALRSA
jgi:hypothetical protein